MEAGWHVPISFTSIMPLWRGDGRLIFLFLVCALCLLSLLCKAWLGFVSYVLQRRCEVYLGRVFHVYKKNFPVIVQTAFDQEPSSCCRYLRFLSIPHAVNTTTRYAVRALFH